MTLAGAGGGTGRSAGNISEQANDAASGPVFRAGFAGRFFGPVFRAGVRRVQSNSDFARSTGCILLRAAQDQTRRARAFPGLTQNGLPALTRRNW